MRSVTRYSPETRSRAVHMVLDDGLAVKTVASELGIVESTLRKWVSAARQRRRGEWWAEQITPAFGFLSGYGFVLTEVRTADWWEVCAIYRADRAALKVVYSIEFNRVEVMLTRAILLDLPDQSKDRVFITGVPWLEGHYADGLLQRSYPHPKIRKKIVRKHCGLEPARVASALEFWAGIIREHAADFLRGDLSLLDKWEGQPDHLVVRVSLPRKATPREEAAVVERIHAVFPDADVVAAR